MHIARLLAPRLAAEDHTTDIDFTDASICAQREADLIDARAAIEQAPWQHEAGGMRKVMHVHDHFSSCSTVSCGGAGERFHLSASIRPIV